MPKIYLVEDDWLQRDWIRDRLKKTFPALELCEIHTESQFHHRFEEIASSSPAGVIIDEMLQWTDEDVVDDKEPIRSYLEAGLRCYKRLRADLRTRIVPVLFYTVLSKSDLPEIPEGTKYLRKDSPDSQLIEWVGGALRASAQMAEI